MANELSAPLPDLTLEEKSLLVVDSGNASSIITRVVIHFAQDLPVSDTVGAPVPPFDVLLAHDPGGGALPPGPVLT